jgi:hypothetical protein
MLLGLDPFLLGISLILVRLPPLINRLATLQAFVRLGDGSMMMVMRYDYADFIPSRDPMPAPGGGPPIAVGGLIQIFSYDNGHTWHDAAVMNGTMLPDQLGPDSAAQPNHPHNVEPKLVRLPALDLLVLSSGRCGTLWFIE